MRFRGTAREARSPLSSRATKTRTRASRRPSTCCAAFRRCAGLYVNTVNCLPVCRALGARGLAGKIKLITTDLFAEMSTYFQKGTITASIYQQPHRQGQIAVRLLADNLTNKTSFPPAIHLSPGVVMSSNLHLFREIRMTDAKLGDAILKGTR